MDYLLLEGKNLEQSTTVAVTGMPGKAVEASWIAGTITGIQEDDWSHHNYFHFDYLNVVPIGPARQSSRAAGKYLGEQYSTLKQAGIEPSPAYEALEKAVLRFEIIPGKLFTFRRFARNGMKTSVDRETTILFAPESTKSIELKGKKLAINGDQYPPEDVGIELDGFHTALQHGHWELTPSGVATLHRASLIPYETKGTFGSTHQNGPWIVRY